MGGSDKLMTTIDGRPLLAWTLDAMAAAPAVARIVVVVAPDGSPRSAAATWLPGSSPRWWPVAIAVRPRSPRVWRHVGSAAIG